MVLESIGLLLMVLLFFVSFIFYSVSVFSSRNDNKKDHVLFFTLGSICLFAFFAVSLTERNFAIGSVRTEQMLDKGVVYVVNYASDSKVGSDSDVENGYLVVLEKKESVFGKNNQRIPRVYLLSVKPPTSFYVVAVEGKLKYHDAAEVR